MSEWPLELTVTVPVVVTAALYYRGWQRLRRRLPDRVDAGRALRFTAGLFVMLIAAAEPVDALAHRSLSAHMVQHLLLMVVVPPLIWMGAPTVPLFVGLPRTVRAPLSTLTRRRSIRWLLDPIVGWLAFALGFWVWHLPALYALALESDLWHHVEHACFLGSALLFWRPVISAWPARSTWPRWTMIPYLGLAMFQSVPLAAILTFSDRVIYAGYSSVDDQALAGAIMWLPGSIPLLVPLLRVVVELSAGRIAVESTHA